MNDRFKFRVWDNSHNQYYDVSKYNIIPCLTPYGLKWYDKGSGMLSTDLDIWGKSQENRFAIEQCTGLKDKNGNLIYEGDIVIWNDGGGETKLNPKKGWIRKAIVRFIPDLSFILTQNTPSGEAGHKFHFGNFIYKQTEKHIKIIGNIHENGDLLK